METLPHELVRKIGRMGGGGSVAARLERVLLRTPWERYAGLAASRIALWFRLTLRYRRQRDCILRGLRAMFDMARIPGVGRPGLCVYFAPHVPGGICRFCLAREGAHPYDASVVERFYVPLLLERL